MNRNTLLYLLIAFAFLLYLIGHHGDSPTGISRDRKTMINMVGQWTDPKGKQGNYISFEWEREQDADKKLVSIMNGVGSVRDLFGSTDRPLVFNFREMSPVQLNVSDKTDMSVLQLKTVDHDHLLVQVLPRSEEEQRCGVLFPPSSQIQLTRTSEGAYVPNW
jgi:hypothetical protein